MTRGWPILFLALSGCGGSPTSFLAGELGCSTQLTHPPDDCGDTLEWRVTCAEPLMAPEWGTDCRNQTGELWSKTWCCQRLPDK